ncbi:hypothetical protein B0H66DRAFT_599885 [Apodospora peruviana]|uniref:Uncharacterized protein n=1 Tax=Apodospora peruviana TaxID=516989 RepID=A0AAE0MBM4_9PEZI|nr:hypothetical protein B0H66DRAFT_599885 [Apodospora peruviana]
MSTQSSPSPLQAPTTNPADDSKMPKGHCRYILLLPEIKGQRCACVCFSLNKGIPGATCDCGHLACFHNKEPEPTSDQKHELELLRKRIQQLEDHLSKGEDDVLDGVVSRLNEVEEHLEKSREEFGDQIKGTYRNVSISWRSIEQVERKNQQHDEQLRQIYERLSDHDQKIQRLQAGQMELQDADLSLEERIENLTETLEEQEEVAFFARTRVQRPRRRSTSDTPRPQLPLGPLGVRGAPLDEYNRPRRSPTTRPSAQGPGDRFAADGTLVPQFLKPLPASARSTGAWTVHISLLPHAFVPMPFERNTNAYQRCLSRGLHQVVAVNGPDAESFTSAVERAFGSFLKGRKWMPLQAKLCDAEQLQGLPMLRQLDPHLVDSSYDHEFLRRHCAVCDAGGMIDSLYIAMRRHTISWHMLRNSPVFMEGLEDAWEYDALLDTDPYDSNIAIDDGERPAAGAITTALPPITTSLKRPLPELSRSNSFGSATAPTAEGDGHRGPKRACPVTVPTASTSAAAGTLVEMRRQGVETA